MTDRVGVPRIAVCLGGGFSDDPDEAIDDYVLSLTRKDKPRICFIPTASGDSAEYIERFQKAFQRRAEPSVLRLYDRSGQPPVDALLMQQDVVYVGGGNTANALALWKLHGVDGALRSAYDAGIIVTGISAGALCWFAAGISDSFGDLRPLHGALGLLPGSCCPHYDSEAGRRRAFEQAIQAGALPDGYGIDDGAAALFMNGTLVEVVAREAGRTITRVHMSDNGLASQRLPSRIVPSPLTEVAHK